MDNSDYSKEVFYSGDFFDAYNYFGCQYNKTTKIGEFRVYAPHAESVSLIGDFNDWDESADYLYNDSGVWSITVKNLEEFSNYKYCIRTYDGSKLLKSDPYAFHSETHAGTNSKVVDISGYEWGDKAWQDKKRKSTPYNMAVNIYEVHIGSWRKYSDGNYFDYRKFADEICDYLKELNYTHIEIMGIAEYPFDGSWGYQVTQYFAPTSRYGTPKDFMYLVDKLHQGGIGIILDWVPGHFPKNENGLYEFDGQPLYEPDDELKKEHKEWGTRCFDYSRGEVKSFLISNALYYLDKYHIDGLRVDAVASMLYLDYNRKEYRPNCYGGRENLDAVEFFQKLNTAVFGSYAGTMMIAEESTAWPLVTKPVDIGGLGFNFKWNMGWMNDTLSYAKTDPLFRVYDHNKMTFSMSYAFSENFILPISHDEVVHGKCSLVNKMPGKYEHKFASWRNYLMYMFAHPGKKLTFMGTEFAQFCEWNFAKELDWMLLDYPIHKESHEFSKTLNQVYKTKAPFWEVEDSWDGFDWRVVDDKDQNVFAFTRTDKKGKTVLVVLNFSASEWCNYRIGVDKGEYASILYSDESGFNTNKKVYKTDSLGAHGKSDSVVFDLKPLCGMYLEYKKPKAINTKK